MEYVKRRKRRQRYYTGEDIDMFREREQENRQKKDRNICDTHIDGAWSKYNLIDNNGICYTDPPVVNMPLFRFYSFWSHVLTQC